jgi:hypothetical protein
MPAVKYIAPSEMPHCCKMFAPIVAAASSAIVATTMPRTASRRLKAASQPRVIDANGPMILSGPSVRNKKVKTFASVNGVACPCDTVFSVTSCADTPAAAAASSAKPPFGWGDLGVAWRYLDYDLKSDGPITDMNFNGPAIGATFRW